MDEIQDTMTTITKEKGRLYTKISALRSLSVKCDWTKDKRMMAGSTMYPYLSAGKVKQNFAPLFAKAGLELELSYGEPKQLEMIETRNSRMQHWLISLRVSIVDIDTGVSTLPCIYWGEGTDVLDKGLRKAMTAAIKSWLSDEFFLEEGIDPEISGNDEASFNPKANEPEIKSKIADAAVKPKTPVKKEEETGTQNTPAEPAKPAAKPAKAKKADEPKKETAEPAKPAEPAPEAPAMPTVLTPGSKTGYKVAGVQEKPLNKIITEWSEALGNGKVSKEKFDAMAKDCEAIADNRSVMQFIVKYRKVE